MIIHNLDADEVPLLITILVYNTGSGAGCRRQANKLENYKYMTYVRPYVLTPAVSCLSKTQVYKTRLMIWYLLNGVCSAHSPLVQ